MSWDHFRECPQGNVPPGAGVSGPVSINETAQSHDSSQNEHHCVETQPGKVNADLLPIILPVKKNFDYYCSSTAHFGKQVFVPA